MNARVFDKSKLPSRHVTEGAARAARDTRGQPLGLEGGDHEQRRHAEEREAESRLAAG